jgi:hypothetical protein
MYTTLNVIALLLFYQHASEYVRDIMRASTLLILVVVATSVWSRPFSIYKALFDSVASPAYQASIPLYTKYGIVFIFDMLFHVVPLLVIGLPHYDISMLIACGILLVWYAIARRRIHEIYTPIISADGSICIAVAAALIGYILLEK